ncbi:hypothetical protein HDU81_007842 [Chytriomyces hyalinus]|nr:hypothetical protein HDU81_007842 [Chytriomyces hyalinus]
MQSDSNSGGHMLLLHDDVQFQGHSAGSNAGQNAYHGHGGLVIDHSASDPSGLYTADASNYYYYTDTQTFNANVNSIGSFPSMGQPHHPSLPTQQQQHQQQQQQPNSTKSSGAQTKRPIRPAPNLANSGTASGSNTAASSIAVSAPSAASSHVRTLPASITKNASAASGTVGGPTYTNAVANQSAFINKLYTMLEEADQSLISWDQTGTFFIVKNTTDFSKAVLPLYFKHNNFASFVRQLNMYGFHKINDSFFKLNNVCSEVWEFKHHDFRRGEFHLLSNIKRKAPKSTAAGGSSTAKNPSTNTASNSSTRGSNYNNIATTTSSTNAGVNPSGSVSSSPMCLLTPSLPGGGSMMSTKMESYADLGMLQTGASFMGTASVASDERVDELTGRVYELESKVATLSESYALVCNEALSCRKELSTYNNVITHVVALLANMATRLPDEMGHEEIELQLAKLAQVTLDATAYPTSNSGTSGASSAMYVVPAQQHYHQQQEPQKQSTVPTLASSNTISAPARSRTNDKNNNTEKDAEQETDADVDDDIPDDDGDSDSICDTAVDEGEESFLKSRSGMTVSSATVLGKRRASLGCGQAEIPCIANTYKTTEVSSAGGRKDTKKTKQMGGATTVSILTPPIGNPHSATAREGKEGKRHKRSMH